MDKFGSYIQILRKNRAKLTQADVDEIRRLYRKVYQKDLAERYGVSKSTIGQIHRGTIWQEKHDDECCLDEDCTCGEHSRISDERDLWIEAFGSVSTCMPKMLIRADDPMAMAEEICAGVRELREEIAGLKASLGAV